MLTADLEAFGYGQRGRELFENGRVKTVSVSNEEAVFEVMDSGSCFHVIITAFSAVCECGEDHCAHAFAAVLKAKKEGVMTGLETFLSIKSERVISAAWNKAHMGSYLKMTPVLQLKENDLCIAVRLGEDKQYLVGIADLISARKNETDLAVREDIRLPFQALWFGYDEESLLFTLEDAPRQAIKGRWLRLQGGVLLSVLEQLKNMPFDYKADGIKTKCRRIEPWTEPIEFLLQGSPMKMTLTASLPEQWRVFAHGAYVNARGKLWSTVKYDRPLFEALDALKSSDNLFGAVFTCDQAEILFGEIIPWIKGRHRLTIEGALKQRLEEAEELTPRVFLDVNGNDIIARIEFRYGQYVINPFDSPAAHPPFLIRNGSREQEIFVVFADAGFRVTSGSIYLSGNDRIFAFLTDAINQLKPLCEIYMSNAFKYILPRKQHFHGTMRTDGEGLRIELLDGEIPVQLEDIMSALAGRRQYFRLPDGSFILLNDMEEWDSFARAFSEGNKPARQDHMQKYQAPWLYSMILEHNLPIAADEHTIKLARMRADVPSPALKGMLPYQLRGYNWLYSLHLMGMGGILADEMGLGKTIQAIAVILQGKTDNAEKKPSLIVAPTSLIYNWRSEINRFAPELETVIIEGSQEKRRKDIEICMNGGSTDILLISYPVLRRDAGVLAQYHFRFVILDEAQEIKNAMTLGAYAVRCISAETRYALTGTPMENHVGEIWSLFDFVLPDYLPPYQEFMQRWGRGEELDELYRRIKPFFMRRMKKDVLEELPEKIEKKILVGMAPDQKNVYTAALYQKRERIHRVINEKGMQRVKGEILSAITELRQICCHPNLCLPDRKTDCGKLELLMRLIPQGLEAGNRFLIFSQFRGMLMILEERLTEAGIKTMTLHGDTPSAERKELTERFNAGDGQVFLISLKAGGTGLNLTGADIVIHYEPWWNPNVEDQADGRAHRIGQTRTVEVWKLITADSIEEKILDLGRKKRQLFDMLVKPGENFPSQLTQDELLSLFEI